MDSCIPVRIMAFQWEWFNGNPRIPVRILGYQWLNCGKSVKVMLKVIRCEYGGNLMSFFLSNK